MNHKWKKVDLEENYKPQFIRKDVCETCGCERHTGKHNDYIYSRTIGRLGQLQAPDCFDMNEENNKTID